MNRFAGKRAVVSGAAGDVGRLVCAALVAEGATVIGLDVDQTAGQQLREDLAAAGSAFRLQHLDITDPGAVHEFALTQGDLDVLINSAGVLSYLPLLDTSIEEWDRVHAVNVRGPFLLMKALAPLLRTGGAVVNVSSGVALRAEAFTSAYSASKAALIALSKVAAAEFAPRVRVNVVCPGVLDTRMPWRLLEGHPAGAEVMATLAEASMTKRLGRAEEVVPLCLFLASDDATLITGATIAADGGASA